MAAKKRPTNDEIQGMLLEGNFGGPSNDEPLPKKDPIVTTQMVLSLQEIKPYDKNPRRERNPKYDEIKDSIRSKKGNDQKFNITRRPGDDLYMIESGGNTRLQILNELYMETADEIFNTVICFFKPWTSDSSLLTAHLIENDSRGAMILIDKAYAVQEIRIEFEKESGGKVSDREFTKMAQKIGYNISPRTLRTFNYAVKLDQMIPLALCSGMGGPKIDHIKKVESSYLKLCEKNAENFEAAFMQVMSESDTKENFDFDQVRSDLDYMLEDIIGIRHNIIFMKVTQIMENNPGNREDVYDPEFNTVNVSTDGQEQSVQQPTTQTVDSSVDFEHEQQKSLESKTPSKRVSTEVADPDIYSESPLDATVDEMRNEEDQNTSPPAQQPPKVSLKRLREKGYALALKIAGKGLQESVMETQAGLGFMMETPPYSLVDTSLKDPENNGSYYRWWILYLLSEQALENGHFESWKYLDIYDRLKLMYNNIEDENDTLVMKLGNQLSAEKMIYYALHNTEMINETLFILIFRLMENCRKIRSNFSEEELWRI